MTEQKEKVLEERLARALRRNGFHLWKIEHIDGPEYARYYIDNDETGGIVHLPGQPSPYELTLQNVADLVDWLAASA